MSHLNTGDQVEFELGTGSESLPRWTYKMGPDGNFLIIDNGYSGNFVLGVVEEVTMDIAFIGHADDEYTIPLEGHVAYKETQWYLPGFPIKVANKYTGGKMCTCGSDKTYGKNNNCHSSWCDKA
jgi:hypothetical protein